MQPTTVESNSPIFQFIQKHIEQKIETITLTKDKMLIKWHREVEGKPSVATWDIQMLPHEFVSLTNTILKLEAAQSVINHFPIGFVNDNK